MVERQKIDYFLVFLLYMDKPSVGLAVVEVQKFEVFSDFYSVHIFLCEDLHNRGITFFFVFFVFSNTNKSFMGINIIETQ